VHELWVFLVIGLRDPKKNPKIDFSILRGWDPIYWENLIPGVRIFELAPFTCQLSHLLKSITVGDE